MKKLLYWKAKARIVCLHKIFPENPLIQGVPLNEQFYYENSPLYVGGYGTYRLLTSKYWQLRYYVYRPGPGRNYPITYNLDIHHYITSVLQPRLEWLHISPQRLERLQKKLVGQKVLLRSTDYLNYGDIAEAFVPYEFESWEQMLDSMLQGLS